jgi:hypothetical protein
MTGRTLARHSRKHAKARMRDSIRCGIVWAANAHRCLTARGHGSDEGVRVRLPTVCKIDDQQRLIQMSIALFASLVVSLPVVSSRFRCCCARHHRSGRAIRVARICRCCDVTRLSHKRALAEFPRSPSVGRYATTAIDRVISPAQRPLKVTDRMCGDSSIRRNGRARKECARDSSAPVSRI